LKFGERSKDSKKNREQLYLLADKKMIKSGVCDFLDFVREKMAKKKKWLICDFSLCWMDESHLESTHEVNKYIYVGSINNRDG